MPTRGDPRQVLDHLPDAVISATMDDEIVYANRAAEGLLGYPRGALVGRRLEEIMPERYRAAHREGMERYRASRVPVLVGRVAAVEALAADGSEVPIELSLSPPYSTQEDEVVVAVLRDLRARVPLGAALSVRDETGLRDYLEGSLSRDARLTADAVEAARLAALARLRVLAEVGRVFGEAGSHAEALQRTAELTAGAAGDWVVIYQLTTTGEEMRVAAAAHRDPAFTDDMALLASLPGARRRPGTGPGASEVVATGRSVLLAPIPAADLPYYAGSPERLEVLRRIGFRSACIAPLRTPSGVLGALVVGAGSHAPLLTDEELRFAEQVADRVAAALGRELLVERVAEHERRLARVLDELPEGVVIRYADGSVTANKAARALTAADLERASRSRWPFEDILLDENAAPVAAHDLPLPRAARGDFERREYVARRSDGALRTLLVNAARLEERDGVTTVAVFQDVSEQRVASRRLALLASISRALLAYAGTDPEEPLRRIVAAVLEHLGDWCSFYLLDDGGALQRVAVHDRDPVHGALVRGYQRPWRWEDGVAGQPFDLDGTPIVVERTADLLRNGATELERRAIEQLGATAFAVVPMVAEGRPIGVLSVVSSQRGGRAFPPDDLEYLKAVAERASIAVHNANLVRAMRERSDELSAVLHASPNGLVLLDAQGRVRQLNAAVRELLDLGEVTRIGSLEQLLERYERAGLVDVEPVRRRLLTLSPDRTSRDVLQLHLTRAPHPHIELITVPVLGREDEYLGRLLLHVDVTRERQLAQQRSDFLTLAAHELRTPLTPLTMQLEMLVRRLQDHSRERGMATKAMRQLHRVTRLVDDLLEYASVEAGRLAVHAAPAELNDVVSVVVDGFRMGLGAGGEIVLHRSPGPIPVEIDRELIERVLENLLSNAVKYSAAGARIDVDVAAEPGEAVVSVTDRGIGIPTKEAQRVFGRFFRGTNAAATHYPGLGIGLYVSDEIVRRHGGVMEVQTMEGKGSRFSFRLPRLADRSRGEPSRRGSILVVDDDLDLLDAAASFLEQEGYDVDRAVDGVQAFERLRRGPAPDLVLLDLMMPRLDGEALLRRMREERVAEDVPVVVVSASTRLAKRRWPDVAGTLAKPFVLDDLQAVVRRFVDAAPGDGA